MPFATINPATGEVVRTFAEHDADELEMRLARAQAASLGHRESSFAVRSGKMLAAAGILEREKDGYARLITREMGKPLAQARAEVERCVTGCRFYAAQAARFLADEPIPEATGRCHLRYEPLGPVLAIMPWNFPFWQAIRFAAPALMAGIPVLLKHAPNVPQCGEALEELFLRAGFEVGCFQNLRLGNEAVERIIADVRVAGVTLTGSVGAGRAVAAAAGRALKRTVLELGGNDPFIVLPSAPLPATVAQAVKARVQNNGQSCISAKRFIVHADIYEEFQKLFVEAFRKLRIGDPLSPDTDVGPMAQAAGVEALERQVRTAVDLGAKILIGGKRRSGPGFYFEPTILTGVPVEGPFAEEELFGPVAMLFPARDLDEALALANGSPYGLGASVWTEDEAEQQRGIRELQAGQVFINGIVVSQAALPFGGIKHSGYGRELGGLGIRELMNLKSVWMPA